MHSTGNGGDGILLLGISSGNSIYGSDFSGNDGAGVLVEDGSDVHIEGTTISENGEVGIVVEDGGILSIEDSTIDDNTEDGIEVQSGGDATISGNTISGNGAWGVLAGSGSTTSISGNDISGNTSGPIHYEDRTNVALGKPATADSYYGSYEPYLAVDGDNSSDASRWLSADTTDPHWIEIDFEQAFVIDEVCFWTGDGGYNEPLPDYKIQVWDDSISDWVTVISRTDNTSSEVDETFDAVLTSKLRLLNDPGVFVKLYELEAYSGGD